MPQPLAHTVHCRALMVQPDVAGRACTLSGRRERKRRRCRPRRHRSQKCGHCVRSRQPPERSFGLSPAQTRQILYIIQPQLLANLHMCCGAVRAASPALPSSGPSPARQAIIYTYIYVYTYISPPQLPATHVDDAGGGAAAVRSAATVCTKGIHPSAPSAISMFRHAR